MSKRCQITPRYKSQKAQIDQNCLKAWVIKHLLVWKTLTFYHYNYIIFFTVHEGIRPHLCSECGKGFHSKSYLLHHIESLHEGKAKYHCESCGKAFKAKEAMRRHQIYVHEGKRFSCNLCSSSYSQPNNLKLHIQKVHEGLGLKINKGRGGGMSFL